MSIQDLVRTIRQNHGLEHATIHLLTRRHPNVTVAGRSSSLSGFVIYGALSTEEVKAAADEALQRLQRGEAHLAIHPRCGTNLAVTGLLAGTAAFGVTLGRPRSRFERLPLALMAAILAALIAQPLAYRVQEEITATADVAGLTIAGLTRHQQGRLVFHRVVVGRE